MCRILLPLLVLQAVATIRAENPLLNEINIQEIKGDQEHVPEEKIFETIKPFLDKIVKPLPEIQAAPESPRPEEPKSHDLDDIAEVITQLGFTPTSHKRYVYVGNEWVSFFLAIQKCRRNGMKLATIETSGEFVKFVQDMQAQGVGAGTTMWIAGVSMDNKGTWEWLVQDNGSPPVYPPQPYQPGQPTGGSGGFHMYTRPMHFTNWYAGYPWSNLAYYRHHSCLQTYPSAFHNYYACSAALPYVCEN